MTLIPGFVDIHVHGGGSFSFCDGPDAARAAADFHRAHGTTSIIASLASATLDELAAQTVELRPLVDSGVLAAGSISKAPSSATDAEAHTIQHRCVIRTLRGSTP